MKKLFISCPMKGRAEEDIRNSMARMHKIAEAYFGQELEIIPTYIERRPTVDCNPSIWCLGESIKKLAEADYFIGVGYCDEFNGCMVEFDVARRYGIPFFTVGLEMMPDALEIERNRWCGWMPKEG